MAGIKQAIAPPQDDEQQGGTPAVADSPQDAGSSGQGPSDQSSGDQSGGDQGQDDSDQQANVTPEEQAAYDQFVTNGMKLIYQKDAKDGTYEVVPAVLGQLKGDWQGVEQSLGQIPQDEKPLDPKSPIDDLAVATVALVLTLEASAANAGKQLDPGVTFHGGVEILEQLADIASAASIHDFTDDEMTGAANRAAMLYGVSSKSMNKQEALAEFDHFLKTQGESLGQSLQSVAQAGQQQGLDQQQAPANQSQGQAPQPPQQGQ